MYKKLLLTLAAAFFTSAAAPPGTSAAATTAGRPVDGEPTRASRELSMGYDLLGTMFDGQGKLWLLPTIRLVTFSSTPIDEVKYVARKLSESGKTRKKQLNEMRKLSPDASEKYATSAESKDPFKEAIAGVVAWRVIKDMLDRSKGTFDLNFVLLQITACRLIAATAKALIPYENNVERRAWLKSIDAEYRALREELKEIINTYVRGEGSEQ